MAWELVAEGDRGNLSNVANIEADEIAEGQRARLDCDTLIPVATWQIDALRDSLSFAGVEDLQISGAGSTISVVWRKGFPWSAVIILALVAVIVVVLWQMFKDVPGGMTVPLIVMGVIAVAIAYSAFKEESHEQA